MTAFAATNVTDETKLSFFRRALKTKQEHERAHELATAALGEHRAVLKAAKKAGVDQAAISRVLRERMLDPEEVLKSEQEYLRMKAISGAPLRLQDDLLGGPTLDLSSADKEKIEEEKAYDDGVFAGGAGHNRSTNKNAPGSSAFDAWDRGWLQGQKQIVSGMAPKRRGRPPAPKKGDLPEASASVN
jgi:hypothetical protein